MREGWIVVKADFIAVAEVADVQVVLQRRTSALTLCDVNEYLQCHLLAFGNKGQDVSPEPIGVS